MNIETLSILECHTCLCKQPYDSYLLQITVEEGEFIRFSIAIVRDNAGKSVLELRWSHSTIVLSEQTDKIKRLIPDLDVEKFFCFVDNTNFKAIELWN